MGRLFSYPDTHLHRLGTSYLQIPVNCPYRVRVANYQRDGEMTVNDNQDGAPNYYPNSFGGPQQDPSAAISSYSASGVVASYDSGDDDNFSQPALFWNNVLKADERERLAKNIGASVNGATPAVKDRMVKMFGNVDREFAAKIIANINMQAKSSL